MFDCEDLWKFDPDLWKFDLMRYEIVLKIVKLIKNVKVCNDFGLFYLGKLVLA